MFRAKIQGKFFDEAATQIKKPLQCQISHHHTNIKGLASEVSNIPLLHFVFQIEQYYRMNTVFLSAHFNANFFLSFIIHQFSVTDVNHQLTEIKVSIGLRGEGGDIYQSHTMFHTIKYTSFHLQHQYYQYLLICIGRKFFHSF
jgi:hypothetical protein